MSNSISLNVEIQDAVQEIDQKCNNIIAGLLFADAFTAKIPYSNDEETQFWYAVTNLYGLFYDCAPYLFRKHWQFGRKEYVEFSDRPKTLLEILESRGCLTASAALEIKRFIYAIGELRSCFCHNKPKRTFNHARIEQSFGICLSSWAVFPYLGSNGSTAFDFRQGLNALQQKTSEILGKISSAITSMSTIRNDDDINSWTIAIAAWYLQSDDVINRCLYDYYDRKRIDKNWPHENGLQIKTWKKQLSPVSIRSGLAGSNTSFDDYIRDWRDDLASSIYFSHTRATAELTLPDFFDEVLV